MSCSSLLGRPTPIHAGLLQLHISPVVPALILGSSASKPLPNLEAACALNPRVLTNPDPTVSLAAIFYKLQGYLHQAAIPLSNT